MSNNHTHVAFEFDAATAENAERIRAWLSDREFCGELEQNERFVFIASECADVTLIANILQEAMQAMPDIPSPQGFEWAFAADKHRAGDFGGGAALVSREPGQLKSIDTAKWLEH